MSAATSVLRWVHSEAMIADGLTKLEAPALQVTLAFYVKQQWALVQDPSFTSSKRRKIMKKDTLDTIDDENRPPVVPSYSDEDPESDFEDEQLHTRSSMTAAVQACPSSFSALSHFPEPHQKLISGLEIFHLQ
eukprot:5084510-Pyramimonas_sp.AAC.1